MALPRSLLHIATALLVFCAFGLHADVPYEVTFRGNLDSKVLEVLRSSSQLVALSSSLPPTTVALERRARSDIAYMLQGLHNLALFNATIDVEIDTEAQPALVTVLVDPGEVFHLAEVHVLPSSALEEEEQEAQDDEEEEIPGLFQDELEEESEDPSHEEERPVIENPLSWITAAHLGICLGEPAYPSSILEAEDTLCHLLQCRGYPLVEVGKREVIADQTAQTVQVRFYLRIGPLAHLAEPRISGNEKVRRGYIRSKIAWRAGDLYSPQRISHTIDRLERTGLFRCVNIQLAQQLDAQGLLPIDISVSEAKHRTVSIGATYSTERGAGFIGEWENRNFRGIGECVRIETELLQKIQQAIASYRIPDFICSNQDLLNQIELEREITDGFHETAFTCSTRLHRRWSCCLHTWVGAAYKYTYSIDSDNDKPFHLLQLPLQLRYSDTDNLLDPTYGYSFNIKCTPNYNLLQPCIGYYVSTFDLGTYVPLDQKKCWVLAGKLSLGSIWGSSRKDIPPPERFYAGSPTLLRGYGYLTVSPLDANNKPLGGRSLMVVSLEVRKRIAEEWGIVGFWDVGNVYDSVYPRFTHKQLQSIGLGVRYYTPVGPLRLDIAHPLDRRPGLDHAMQIYFSIGQTF